jgi:Small integral membrane protein
VVPACTPVSGASGCGRSLCGASAASYRSAISALTRGRASHWHPWRAALPTVHLRRSNFRHHPVAGHTGPKKGDGNAALRRCFLVIALIAAVFGFGGIAAGAAGIAKILFFVFVIMAIVTFALGLMNKR